MKKNEKKVDNQQKNIEKSKNSKMDNILTVLVTIIVVGLVGYNIINFYAPYFFMKGISLSILEGKDPYSMKYKVLKIGNEKTVVNFWGTWCSACVSELPVFKKATGKIKIIGALKAPVNRSSLRIMGLKYPLIVVDNAIFTKFKISAVPTTVLIENHKIKKVKIGVISYKELQDWILN